MQKWIVLFALAFSWGPSFLFIKLGLTGFAPTAMVFYRLCIALVLLFVLGKCLGVKFRGHLKYWHHFAIMGLTANTLPFLLFAFAEERVSSALAGIINGTVPVFVALLAFPVLKEKIGPLKWLGIFMGIGGICVIFFPDVTEDMSGHIAGVIMLIGAAISYAIAMVYSKRFLSEIADFVAPMYQMIFAILWAIVPFLFYHEAKHPTTEGIIGICGLGVFGTAIAFFLYYRLIKIAGAMYLSTATLLFPIIAVILGMTFLGEKPSHITFLGCLLILGGLGVMNRSPRRVLLEPAKPSDGEDRHRKNPPPQSD